MNNSTTYQSDSLETLNESDSERRPQPSHAAPEFGAITRDGLVPVDDFRDSTYDPDFLDRLREEAEATSLTTLESVENRRRITGEATQEGPGYSWQLKPEAAEGAINRHPSVQGELAQPREELSQVEGQLRYSIQADGPMVVGLRYGTLKTDFGADAPPSLLTTDTHSVNPNLN